MAAQGQVQQGLHFTFLLNLSLLLQLCYNIFKGYKEVRGEAVPVKFLLQTHRVKILKQYQISGRSLENQIFPNILTDNMNVKLHQTNKQLD